MTLDDNLVAGSGLNFPHGPLVINSSSVIGISCTIHPQVLIGGDRGKSSPTIGNNVFIESGAIIIGSCKIGDCFFIASGAVITKDIPLKSLVGYVLNNILNGNGKRYVELYL